jgi:type III secretion protein J
VKDMVAHSIEGLTHDQVSLSLFEARRPAVAAGTAGGAGGAKGQPMVLGLFSTSTAMVLLGLLLLAAVCLMVLPTLLRRQGLDWRSWTRRQVFRR